MLLTGGVVSPQDLPQSSQPPGVTVPECKWQKSRYIQSLPDYPHRHSVEEVKQGMPNSAPPMMGALPDAYLYSIRVKNEGPKVIKSMSWDYVFNAPGYPSELGRLSFDSYEKINLNETKWINLKPVDRTPPALDVVAGLKKDRRSPYDEHIEIKCVLYTDGTGWKAPDTDAKTCDELLRLTLHPDARRN